MARSATAENHFALPLGQASVAALAIWLATFAAAIGFGQGTWRPGLIVGVIAGGVGGAIGLAILGLTQRSPVRVAMSARLVGFMFRFGLIAVGLLLTMRAWHGEPLAFVLGFFPLFFMFTGLEHLVSLTALSAPARRSDG